jgi:hypothetical protein
LQELTDTHPRDLTFLLKRLVAEHFLVGNDKRRWSSYSLVPEVSSVTGADSSQHKEANSHRKDESFHHKEVSYHHNEASFHHKIPSDHLSDETQILPTDMLPLYIQEIRGQQRTLVSKMDEAILALCTDRFVMAQELAELLRRSIVTIKNHYIARLIRQGRLALRFPEQPTHPAQAYRAKAGNKDEAEKS